MDLLLTVAGPGANDDNDVSVSVDPSAPVEELARALADAVGSPAGPPPSLVVERTGQRLAPQQPVGQADLRFGDRVVLSDPQAKTRSRAAFELVVTEGAGAGRRIPLAAGASVQVGRDPACELALDDERVSRRHLHIGAGSRSVQLTDLGSSNGTYVDGDRVTGTVTLKPGQIITVGDTTLTVRAVRAVKATDAAVTAVDGRLAFAAPPRIQRPTPSPVIVLPRPPQPPPPRRIPMVASLLPVVLGLVMAYFMGPIMLLFAAMGPVMMLGSVWEDKRSGRRDYAKARKAFEEEMAALEARVATTHDELVKARREAAPDLATLSERVRELRPQLWERRATDRDFAALRIGIGDRPSGMRLDHDPTMAGSTEAQRIEQLLGQYAIDPQVPVNVDLRTVGVIGITGDPAQRAALLRWLVVQSCTLASPRDLALVVLAPDDRDWTWTRWFPHTETLVTGIPGARSVAFDPEDARLVFGLVDDLLTQRRSIVDRSGAPAGPWRPQVLLVLPGEPGGGASTAIPRSALSRVLAEGPALGITAIVGAATAAQLPGECKAVVAVAPGTGTTVTFTATGETVSDVRADGIDRDHAADLARGLAPVQDSSAASASADVPRRVLLLDLLQLRKPTAELITQRWQRHATLGDLAAPIGAGAAGPVSIDLRRDGPHGLTAGTTGAGKSELLQSMIGAFAATYPASRLTFVLIDYKGGAAFKDCVDLPHTVGFFTDLDAHLARRALTSLNAELRRREHILREHGAKDIIEMEQLHPDHAPANLFLIIDEFAFLKKEVPEFVAGIIDRPDAARIPKSLPGRGLVRTGHSDITVMQSAYANARSAESGEQRQPTTAVVAPPGSGLRRTATGSGAVRHDDRPTDLQRLVAAIRTAHENLGVPTPPRPWLDPLPAVVSLDELSTLDAPAGTSELAAPIGLLDQPSAQAQPPGWLDLGHNGHVLIYGTGGAGKTQALRSLAVSLANRLSPADLQLYGLDFAGGGLRPLAALPHTGGVVTADERERVDRLLAMLDALIGQRRARFSGSGVGSLPEYRERTGDRLPYVVVVFDGYGAFHQAYLNVDRGEQVDTIARLVADGRGVGVYFVLTADRRNAVPATLTSAISTRLVLRMADADEYASLGLPLAIAGTTLPPGRGFIDGTEVQVGCAGQRPVRGRPGRGDRGPGSTTAGDQPSRNGAGRVRARRAARTVHTGLRCRAARRGRGRARPLRHQRRHGTGRSGRHPGVRRVRAGPVRPHHDPDDPGQRAGDERARPGDVPARPAPQRPDRPVRLDVGRRRTRRLCRPRRRARRPGAGTGRHPGPAVAGRHRRRGRARGRTRGHRAGDARAAGPRRRRDRALRRPDPRGAPVVRRLDHRPAQGQARPAAAAGDRSGR